MIRLIKTGIIILSAILLAWALPWFHTFISANPSWTPFTLYSCITHCFAYIDYDENGNMTGKDMKGGIYTESQMDSILPLFYYRQLASEGRLPSEIEGVPVTVEKAETTGFIFRTSPYDINKRRPGIYQMLESAPERVDFKAPDDVFRITDEGIQFVDIGTNRINKEKSRLFTGAMLSSGFSFPAIAVAGNGSPKKEYDNGYLILDSAGKLFHIKQVRGVPHVNCTGAITGDTIRHIFVTEFPDRKLLGIISGSSGKLYGLLAEDYSLHEIPAGGFDPASQEMTIIGDMLYWTITISGLESERLVAMNARTWEQVDSYILGFKREGWEERAEFLFPFSVSFTSPLDSYVQPRFRDVSAKALIAGALLAAIYAVLRRKKRKAKLCAECACILLGGIYIFIPLMVFSPKK